MHTKWLWDIMPCELRLDDPEGTVLLRCVHTHEPSEDAKRLIATAPELLGVVTELLVELEHADPDWIGARLQSILDAGTRAIRKARGDSNDRST